MAQDPFFLYSALICSHYWDSERKHGNFHCLKKFEIIGLTLCQVPNHSIPQFPSFKLTTVLTLREFLGGLNVLIIMVSTQYRYLSEHECHYYQGNMGQEHLSATSCGDLLLPCPPRVLYFRLLSGVGLLEFLLTFHIYSVLGLLPLHASSVGCCLY